jgi:hypothetical protein
MNTCYAGVVVSQGKNHFGLFESTGFERLEQACTKDHSAGKRPLRFDFRFVACIREDHDRALWKSEVHLSRQKRPKLEGRYTLFLRLYALAREGLVQVFGSSGHTCLGVS